MASERETSAVDAGPKTYPFDVWTRANAGEVLPGVVSPLAWSILADFANHMASGTLPGFQDAEDVRFVALFEGRVYINIGALYHFLVERRGLPSAPFFALFGGPDESQGLPLPHQPLRWRKLIRHLPALRPSRREREAPQAFPKAIPRAEALAAELNSLDVASLTDAELAGWLRHLEGQVVRFRRIHWDCGTAAFASFGTLLFYAEQWLGDASAANDLVAGLTMTKTAEASAELWRIAQAASQQPGLRPLIEEMAPGALLEALDNHSQGRPIGEALRDFLARYGHRCADELDLAKPRWVEEPAPILAIFRSYVLEPPLESPEQVTLRQQRAREAAYEQARAKIRRGLGRLFSLRWLLFRDAIRMSQRLMPLREDPKFYFLKITVPQRRLLLELARRLVARDILDRTDDVFFLTTDELDRVCTLGGAGDAAAGVQEQVGEASRSPQDAPEWRALAAELRSAVASRRVDHERWLSQEPPPVLGPEGRPLALGEPPRTAEHALRGLGACSGRVTGIARVITSPEEGGEMREGEILVAPFTDPGWTPLFPLARALVTDLGGLLSHGAVVAREYGVPAVVNTRFATQRVRTGDRLTVDGAEGIVYLEPPASTAG